MYYFGYELSRNKIYFLMSRHDAFFKGQTIFIFKNNFIHDTYSLKTPHLLKNDLKI